MKAGCIPAPSSAVLDLCAALGPRFPAGKYRWSEGGDWHVCIVSYDGQTVVWEGAIGMQGRCIGQPQGDSIVGRYESLGQRGRPQEVATAQFEMARRCGIMRETKVG